MAQERHDDRDPLVLSVLRDFELRCGDTLLDVPPTAQRLLGFLAFQHGRPARRSFVSGSLWLDLPEQRGSASLRSAIWRCPDIDGVPVVRANNTHLWLDPGLEVDLDLATERAKNLLDLPSVEPSSIDIASEVRCFGEDVLVGWYDEWVVGERERFHQLRLHVLEQLGELLLRAHRYSEAVQVGLVAVSSEPLRDSSQRLLIRAHLCEGNLADALRQYRLYADMLDRELRVTPSEAMEELIATAVSGASSTRWPVGRRPDPSVARTGTD